MFGQMRRLAAVVLSSAVVCAACSSADNSDGENEIDMDSARMEVAPRASVEITSCEKDDLDRPVAVVAITNLPDSTLTQYRVEVRFESLDRDTDYGRASTPAGSFLRRPGATVTQRLTGFLSAPGAIRCRLVSALLPQFG